MRQRLSQTRTHERPQNEIYSSKAPPLPVHRYTLRTAHVIIRAESRQTDGQTDGQREGLPGHGSPVGGVAVELR